MVSSSCRLEDRFSQTAGVERTSHYLAMELPHSDDRFVAALCAETPEDFLESRVRTLAYSGRVPTQTQHVGINIAQLSSPR
jgi:hypothetical protein